MIYKLLKREAEELATLEAGYVKLIDEIEARAKELAPGDQPEDPDDFKKWQESGSAEWKQARQETLDLFVEYTDAVYSYRENVYDKHFKKVLAKGPDAIVQSAKEEIDEYIKQRYKVYEHIRTTGINENGTTIKKFSADDVRVMPDGSFYLDAIETGKMIISSVVSRHLQALKNDKTRSKAIKDYLSHKLEVNPHVSYDKGILRDYLPVSITKPEDPPRLSVNVITPTHYVMPLDRVTKNLFDNKLTVPFSQKKRKDYELRLTPKGSERKVCVYVSLSYNEVLKEALKANPNLALPQLSIYDQIVYNGICSCVLAGNRALTYAMIYKAMTGMIDREVKITDRIRQKIDEALDKFRGIFYLKYYYMEDGKEQVQIFDAPLLSFERARKGEVEINGTTIKDGCIELLYGSDQEPVLLEWARFNNNEFDTRDITLLDVPGINNDDESASIKLILYNRIVEKRNAFEKKKKAYDRAIARGQKVELEDLKVNERCIRYDYIYKELGVQDPNEDKRSILKGKIDECLRYWKERGLIADYEHVRVKVKNEQTGKTTTPFVRVELHFIKKQKNLPPEKHKI